jgi:Tol biopolymer transport system component
MRGISLVGLVAVAAVAVSGAGSAPARAPAANGRIVFASARPLAGEPYAGEIYSLNLASGKRRALSRTSADDTALALSRDGALIAFARASDTGGNRLWVMRRDGSGQRLLANLEVWSDARARVQEIAWSPDGTRIVFTAIEQPAKLRLWIVNPDGSGLRLLADFPADAPRWSPDGTKIAFSGSDGDPRLPRIGVISPDGTGLRWVTDAVNAADTEPAWAPGGTRIAFVRTQQCEPYCGSSNLFSVAADGSSEQQITAFLPGPFLPIPLGAPAWSRDGSLLAFLRDPYGGDLGVIGSDGSGLRTLAAQAFAPATWSPSGDRLAFMQGSLESGLDARHLTVLGLDGHARHYGLNRPTDFVRGGPYWSNDGKTLVYASFLADIDLELFSARPDGSRLRRLTHDRLDEIEPAWSPKGRRIAFARVTFNEDRSQILAGSLYVMDASGRHVRRLTGGFVDTGPSWAPGGKRIVFNRANTLTVRDLAARRTYSLKVRTDSDPAWSPDGRLIAFSSRTKLETVRANGKGRRLLFDGGSNGDFPAEIGRASWSPDGKYLAFEVVFNFDRTLERHEVIVTRSGDVRRTFLCDPPAKPFDPEGYQVDTRLAWAPDGKWLAVDGLAVCGRNGAGGYWLRPGTDPDWLARWR